MYSMALRLKELLHTLIHPEKNWKTNLLYQWHDIIGSLHSKVRIEKIYDDTLILGVFHSCWMQELYLLSPLLIKTINEKLDQPHIKQIRFKHVGLKELQKKSNPHNLAKKKKNAELTKDDERTLAKIADPALRNVLKAFRIRCYQE
jgi:Dna[CI] antecedent, DciA